MVKFLIFIHVFTVQFKSSRSVTLQKEKLCRITHYFVLPHFDDWTFFNVHRADLTLFFQSNLYMLSINFPITIQTHNKIILLSVDENIETMKTKNSYIRIRVIFRGKTKNNTRFIYKKSTIQLTSNLLLKLVNSHFYCCYLEMKRYLSWPTKRIKHSKLKVFIFGRMITIGVKELFLGLQNFFNSQNDSLGPPMIRS